MRMSIALLALLLATVSGRAVALVCPDRPVQIAFADRAAGQFLRGQGSSFVEPDPGRAVLEVRAAVKALGCPAVLSRLPHARLVQGLDDGDIDLAVGYHDLPERVQRWRFPMTPEGQADRSQSIAVSPVAWVVLKDRKDDLEPGWRNGSWRGRFGVAKDTVADVMARAANVPTERVVNLSEVGKLLALRRFDAIGLPVVAFAEELAASPVPLATLEPPLGQLRYFAPASRRFFERSPDYVHAFWTTLCDVVRRRPDHPGCVR